MRQPPPRSIVPPRLPRRGYSADGEVRYSADASGASSRARDPSSRGDEHPHPGDFSTSEVPDTDAARQWNAVSEHGEEWLEPSEPGLPRRRGRHSAASAPRQNARPVSGPDRGAQRSLASLALASGTGEGIAALAEGRSRPRWRLEGAALRALVVALLLALLCTVAWLSSQQPSTSATGTGALPQVSTSAGGGPSPAMVAPPASTPQSSGNFTTGSDQSVVHISGAVTSPGVYTVPTNSRVNDVVQMAGGMTQDADQAAINLAAPIRDGDHVHIAAVGETPVPAAGGSGEQIQSGQAGGSGLVNINTATTSELQELPGIGPVLADAIVAWREENGGFSAPEELMEVSGIGQATFEKLRDHVVV
ncbi:helix-hairpin-helix domain-containing protein [Actinobaculum sp. 352]|uniref:helix-hairpin-helix domain-containing protein n=1 Tax=Actinobaculum sp. 352 TaxID=2490946 RepID=UPI000F7DC850|nr:helix-hairpin-helix domain-containing protein [Actinobaculum sp. 352]RTE50850.1 hypothetical protein EKN07_01600 [Actinobaculum sp. 352]